MRVYIDTSIVGGCFDEEFNHESVELFEMAKSDSNSPIAQFWKRGFLRVADEKSEYKIKK